MEMLEQAEMVVHAPTITVMLMAVAGTAETAETVTEDRAKMVRTPQAVSHVSTILEQSPAVMGVQSPKNVR